MIKGTVAGISGSSIRVRTGDSEETTCACDKRTVRINIIPNGGEDKDAQTGKLSQIDNGDEIRVYGEPGRAHTLTVTKGDAAAIREASEYNDRRNAGLNPTTVHVKAAGGPEGVKSLPPAAVSTPDEAPPEVPYGQRRKWREAQAKKAEKERGGEHVKQTADDKGATAGDEDDADTTHPDNADLKEATNEQLHEIAKKEGIELHGASTKAELQKTIRAGRRKATKGK